MARNTSPPARLDNVTLERVSGIERVKNGGITGEKLAANSVDQFKIASGVVTTSHLSTAAITGAKIADGTIGQAKLAAGSVGQSQLKTAIGSVSSNVSYESASEFLQSDLVLPGGEYGFFPQLKVGSAGFALWGGAVGGQFQSVVGKAAGATSLSFVSTLSLYSNSAGVLAYAQQRYIQSSPPYKIGQETWGHFLYVLRRVADGKILCAYEAEDPCWAYNGRPFNEKDSVERVSEVPHPFPAYFDKDPATDGLEIALIDLRDFDMAAWKVGARMRGKSSVLDEVDLIVKPTGQERQRSYYNLPSIARFDGRVKLKTRE